MITLWEQLYFHKITIKNHTNLTQEIKSDDGNRWLFILVRQKSEEIRISPP